MGTECVDLVVLAFLLSACGPVGASAPLADTPSYQKLVTLPAAPFDEVLSASLEIQDPTVRGAAIDEWLSTNAAKAPAGRCHELCDSLRGYLRHRCERLCSSPHLMDAPHS